MQQYKNLLQDILDGGEWKKPARENMPRTKSIFGTQMKFDLRKGFPLLTTKKMYFKGVVGELLWFLRGNTNIRYLIDNNIHIWDQDAYRWYLKKCSEWDNKHKDSLAYAHFKNPLKIDRFIELTKRLSFTQRSLTKDYVLGDLGKVYGHQWRNQSGIDQVAECIESIKSNPESRYHIIDAWNKADFKDMALPPCHLLYQFNCVEICESTLQNGLWLTHGLDLRKSQVREYAKKYNYPTYYLDLQMKMRSVDTFLGLPFNIASSALLLEIMAQTVNMLPRNLTWVGGDTHIYENHFDQVCELLERNPLDLCSISINKELNSITDIENLIIEDVELINYSCHPAIKAKLSTGLK